MRFRMLRVVASELNSAGKSRERRALRGSLAPWYMRTSPLQNASERLTHLRQPRSPFGQSRRIGGINESLRNPRSLRIGCSDLDGTAATAAGTARGTRAHPSGVAELPRSHDR